MTAFTDTTGGSSVQPADPGYNALTLISNTALVWPPYASSNNYLAGLMDITPVAPGLNLATPDATLASQSAQCLFNNKGLYPFNLTDYSGNVIAVIQPSDVRFTYLIDSSTQAGLWSTVLFGKSNSTADSSQFVGPGLKAINNTLAWAPATTLIGGSTTLDASSRSKMLVWTGGTGSLGLPTLNSAGSDYVFEIRNQGTGVVTLQPQNSEPFDGGTNIQLQQNESCLVHASAGSWYSVGRGRSTLFNFSQLTKNLTGGTVTLTLTEASNVVQTYTGTLASGQIVVLPQVVQVYYVSNQTSGAFTVTLKTAATGTTLVVPTGQNMVVFCDGVNVINASTTTAGLTSLILTAGSAGSPAITIGAGGNGLYAPGTNQVGMAVNGLQGAQWDVGGYKVTGSGAVLNQTVSVGGAPTDALDGPAGQSRQYKWRSNGADRWSWEAGADAETGSSAGSTLNLNAYADNGTLIGSALQVTRASRILNFTFMPTAAGAPLVGLNLAQTLQNKILDGNLNTFRNIPASAVQGSTGGTAPPINYVDTTSAQTLFNKTINGGSNLLVNIPFSALAGVAASGVNRDITQLTVCSVINNDVSIQRDAAPGTGAILYGNTGKFIFQNGVNFSSNMPWIMLSDLQVNGAFTNPSDERLKSDWAPLAWGFAQRLSKVKAGTYIMKPRAFEGPDGTHQEASFRTVGVSAQDLKQVMPEAVKEDSDGYLSVNYGQAALAACVELAKELEQLKKQLLRS